MIQSLEWEPSGSFYRPNANRSGQSSGSGPSRSNVTQDIVDPTLPSNPRKSLLYRPSLTHFLAVSMDAYFQYTHYISSCTICFIDLLSIDC